MEIEYKSKAKPKDYYLENINNLNRSDVRIFNWLYLHPHDQKLCNGCKQIYTNIPLYFPIAKLHQTRGGHFSGWNHLCKKCLSKRNAQRKNKYRQDPYTFLLKSFSGYRFRAKYENLPINIEARYLADLFESQHRKCFYTGIDISFEFITEERNRPHYLSPSLDRLDPDKGYVEGNVVWCAYYINRMKNNLSYQEFISTCHHIVNIIKPHAKDLIPIEKTIITVAIK